MPDRAVVEDDMCRECGRVFPTEELRAYDVVRDGGDEYPNTVLCSDCLEEYRNNPDVEEIVSWG